MQKIKFRFNHKHLDSYNTPGVLNLMFLDLTNQCNLRCRYCFNRRKLNLRPSHLGIELLNKALRSPISKNVKNWFLSGGEPLCYPDLFEALALFQEFGHRPKIATNGILLKPDIVDQWVSLGVQSVQVSLDSLRPAVFHELNKGSEENLRAIIENLTYAIRSPLRVVVSSVLTKVNGHDIQEIMRFCYKLGIDSYTLYPNVPAAKINTDLLLPLSDQIEVFDRLLGEYAAMCPVRLVDMSIPCVQNSELYSRWNTKLDLRLHPCGAGQFNLKITNEGRVSACICQDAPEFVVGDLHDRDIDEIWVSPEIEKFRSLYKDIPACRACSIQSQCRGGCRNEAFVFGSQGILSSDPHCDYFKSRNMKT
jgi:radical SAM protein with 4Fe4S-binding SPASM domain